ncbi:cytochrome c oxidase subunit 7 [Aspergillus clavatus NRRL 1]|uniref:Uncharacterized protein n=1 Tax=Aspergillus clavatus (strain ATCC 1007 / CBS 513.65 / DSM 816 / NCTC 3887 / NRRL 1 / QM 1276 / 107) TaxID=344612 RepID=A1CHT2_ASPCL|nr:uncharacterized protein ACLA_049090 [Aspergillus clavatus NRRL 1]EAW10437.1 conserved hypothetical protein [Aspergillus clavatus NRRL 1]
MFRTAPRMAGFVFRENRVPYYQRLFQQHDGKRQWWKTERSGYVMYPYLISVYGMGIATTYAMCRMVFVSVPLLIAISPKHYPNILGAIFD